MIKYFSIPNICPVCGADTIIKKDNERIDYYNRRPL